MLTASTWTLDPVKILTRRELASVLAETPRSVHARMNRVILRLVCCCGQRVSEIAALRLEDVNVESGRPHLRIRPEAAKGKRGRDVSRQR